jgi:Bacterial PH domain
MPIDRGIIDQQLEALGEGSRWWEQRELRDLPAVLESDEQILAISRGKVARLRWMRRSWLIVVTQRRLLCLRSSARTWRQLEVGASQIARVSLRIGPFRGRVVVATGGQTYRLLVPSADAYKLQSALSSLGTAPKESFSRFGPTRIVHRMIDHVLALPAVALGPDMASVRPPAPDAAGRRALAPAERSMIDERLQSLEREVQELRQQVEFLEQLLRQRHAASSATEGLGSM